MDSDFTTQECISPGMSYAQVKKKVTNIFYESSTDCIILSTNEETIIFYLQLKQHWKAWFRGEYVSTAKSPDDNDHIVYIDCGLPHSFF